MAYLDSNYAKHARRKQARKPWRAFYYANNKRTYLGNFRTKEEAEAREYQEKLRRQNELLVYFPEEIKVHRQQNLLDQL